MRGEVKGQSSFSLVQPAEHFTVDGTLIEAWAGVKSFKKKGGKDEEPPDDKGNPTVNFHGEKRSNVTHESTTDPESRLARKGGNGAKLSYSASVLMENRTGLVADITVELATGEAEWTGALRMLDRQKENGLTPTTLGADAGYDVQRFVDATRERGITPHVAQTRDVRRASRVDGRTTRHAGHALSQRARKRVEEIFENSLPRPVEDGAVGLLRRCRLQSDTHGPTHACLTRCTRHRAAYASPESLSLTSRARSEQRTRPATDFFSSLLAVRIGLGVDRNPAPAGP